MFYIQKLYCQHHVLVQGIFSFLIQWCKCKKKIPPPTNFWDFSNKKLTKPTVFIIIDFIIFHCLVSFWYESVFLCFIQRWIKFSNSMNFNLFVCVYKKSMLFGDVLKCNVIKQIKMGPLRRSYSNLKIITSALYYTK